jgi:hypothetical protein
LAMSNTLLRQLIGKVWRVMLRHHELSWIVSVKKQISSQQHLSEYRQPDVSIMAVQASFRSISSLRHHGNLMGLGPLTGSRHLSISTRLVLPYFLHSATSVDAYFVTSLVIRPICEAEYFAQTSSGKSNNIWQLTYGSKTDDELAIIASDRAPPRLVTRLKSEEGGLIDTDDVVFHVSIAWCKHRSCRIF